MPPPIPPKISHIEFDKDVYDNGDMVSGTVVFHGEPLEDTPVTIELREKSRKKEKTPPASTDSSWLYSQVFLVSMLAQPEAANDNSPEKDPFSVERGAMLKPTGDGKARIEFEAPEVERITDYDVYIDGEHFGSIRVWPVLTDPPDPNIDFRPTQDVASPDDPGLLDIQKNRQVALLGSNLPQQTPSGVSASINQNELVRRARAQQQPQSSTSPKSLQRFKLPTSCTLPLISNPRVEPPAIREYHPKPRRLVIFRRCDIVSRVLSCVSR